MKNNLRYFCIVLMYTIIGGFPTALYASELNLAVANSTCSAIKKVGQLFEQRNSTSINYICKSSGRLAKGLNGNTITADIYISANRKWMDYMIENRLVEGDDVISPWGNKLVVATKKDSQLQISEWSMLTSNEVRKILIGDPGTAPFGRYAKEALQSTDIWEKVKYKIETKKHITLLAETLADSDVNTVGILFASNITARLRKIYAVNNAWHSPIRYYMAPIKGSDKKDEVLALLEFIQESKAQEIFRAAEFKVDAQ